MGGKRWTASKIWQVVKGKSSKASQLPFLIMFELAKEQALLIGLGMVSKQSRLLIRPLGVGSFLLEARVMSESDLITEREEFGDLKIIQENIVKLGLQNTAVTNKSMDVLATFPRPEES